MFSRAHWPAALVFTITRTVDPLRSDFYFLCLRLCLAGNCLSPLACSFRFSIFNIISMTYKSVYKENLLSVC